MTAKKLMAAEYAGEIRSRLKTSDPDELEVIDALGYACSMTAPRTFSGRVMTQRDWREMAKRIDYPILEAVSRGLRAYGARVNNRCWYILGSLAKEFQQIEQGRCRSGRDFEERIYTEADFKNHIRRIDQIRVEDL